MKKSILHKTTLLLALLAATAFNLHAHNGVLVSPKMYLKGALQSNGLMRDELRAKGLLPSTEPYSALANFQHYGDGGGETISSPRRVQRHRPQCHRGLGGGGVAQQQLAFDADSYPRCTAPARW
ncbi:MAG: hypothetical protein IPM82_30605 [Saprospiraceae bacterium]|nr:hypothetical protein [Saprospiraceae bacterium]